MSFFLVVAQRYEKAEGTKMKILYFLKSLVIVIPHLIAALFTGSSAASDSFVGRYVNINNSQDVIIVRKSDDYMDYNNGNMYYDLSGTCDGNDVHLNENLEGIDLINVHSGKYTGEVQGHYMTIRQYFCRETFKKID